VLDGADPLLGPANQRPERGLSEPAPTPVERDAVTNAELISCSRMAIFRLGYSPHMKSCSEIIERQSIYAFMTGTALSHQSP
jgi:hypothetical protein